MQYAIPARVEYSATVIVEAESPAEALAKFRLLNWVDDQQGELLDWEATGTPDPMERDRL